MKSKTKATQQGAYQLLDDVFDLVGSFAKFGQALAAKKIETATDAANSFVRAKRDLPDIKAQLSSAAGSLEAAADYAVHTDVKHMANDVAIFARKHPVAALISVVAAGAIISRFMQGTPAVSGPAENTEPARRTQPAKRSAPAKRTTSARRMNTIPKPAAKKTAVNRPRKPANGSAQAHA